MLPRPAPSRSANRLSALEKGQELSVQENQPCQHANRICTCRIRRACRSRYLPMAIPAHSPKVTLPWALRLVRWRNDATYCIEGLEAASRPRGGVHVLACYVSGAGRALQYYLCRRNFEPVAGTCERHRRGTTATVRTRIQSTSLLSTLVGCAGTGVGKRSRCTTSAARCRIPVVTWLPDSCAKHVYHCASASHHGCTSRGHNSPAGHSSARAGIFRSWTRYYAQAMHMLACCTMVLAY